MLNFKMKISIAGTHFYSLGKASLSPFMKFQQTFLKGIYRYKKETNADD